MRRYHRLFECEREGKSKHEAGYELGRQNLEHRDIIHARGVVEYEYEGDEQRVGENGRYGGKKWFSSKQIRADCADEGRERAEYHIEYSERREKEVGEETAYRKPGDCLGEYEREQNQNFRYAKLYRAERYCGECYG